MKLFKSIKLTMLLCFISIFTLTSCSIIFSDNYTNIKSSKTCLNYDISQNDINEMHKSMDNIDYYVSHDETIRRNTFVANFNYAYETFIKIRRAYTIEYISYCMYRGYDNQENYLKFEEEINSFISWLHKNYVNCYNSEYKSIMFEGMTEDEILELVENQKSDKYYELVNEKSKIEAQYSALNQNERIENGSHYIAEIININKKIVKETEYTDYIDYSYKEEYSRDYDYNITLDYATYIQRYMFDYASSLSSEYKTLFDDSKSANNDQYKTYLSFNSSTSSETKKYIKDYVTYMSGTAYTSFLNEYNNLKEGKNYFLWEDSNSYQGAFTTLLFDIDGNEGVTSIDPVMYFGYGYYDPSTIMHEFGHYYHYKQTLSSTSYDLAETHSQANEALFWRYLLDKSDLGENAKLYSEHQLLEGIRTIILCSIVNTFEIKAYQKENLTEEDIDTIVDEVLNEYYTGFDSVFDGTNLDFDRYDSNGVLQMDASSYIKKYIKLVSVTSSLYYISYSTSFLSTLNIYNEAAQDFDSAKDKYMSLSKESGDLVEALEKVGFTSPFNEETFKNICNIEENLKNEE
ncbi:MAG: hypothetical protein K6E20_00545 [Acholeplasmatales bacterium]|nr:hypothetical protein [Acholeplasmatales bacterium]